MGGRGFEEPDKSDSLVWRLRKLSFEVKFSRPKAKFLRGRWSLFVGFVSCDIL